MAIEDILKERKKTHGDFLDQAKISQAFKDLCFGYTADLSDHQIEALEMIFHKIARILNGDPNFPDHWDDIAGYASLVAMSLKDTR